ncbi:putative Secretion protein HlyD [Burkholderiales bacterium GJ-E10]|nr:putative Secretion protein HlyD [Burkholderiales bacterium GJ-E10]
MKKIVLAMGLSCCAAGAAFAQEATAQASALVQTVAAQQRVLTRTVTGFGAVAFAPGGVVNGNFAKAGRVVRVAVAAGERVRRGEVLIEIAADPSASLAYAQAGDAARYARQEMARTRSLFARQLATRAQLDAAQRALADAEHALAAQRAMGAQIGRDRLVAPFDGTVVSVAAVPGDRFAAGANLVQVARADRLRAMLGVESADGRGLRPGLAVALVSVSDPRSTGTGTVAWVGGGIDPQTGLIPVAVRVESGSLLAGARVRGDIAVTRRRVLAVPRQAVLREGSQAYLFQVADRRAHRVAVQTGIEDAGWTEVRGRLASGEPVVVLGNYELQDGMTVREESR